MSHDTQDATDPAPPLEPLLKIDDVAALLNISRRSVYTLVESRELTPTRVGQRPRFTPADIRAYLKRQREGSP
jgi:excisionase family DNA binding protein